MANAIIRGLLLAGTPANRITATVRRAERVAQLEKGTAFAWAWTTCARQRGRSRRAVGEATALDKLLAEVATAIDHTS
jgi:hypothetical protein